MAAEGDVEENNNEEENNNKEDNVDKKAMVLATKDYTCGWGCFACENCNRFRSPKWVLAMLSLAAIFQGFAVNGLVNVVITTLERRFHLTSTKSGFIPSSYDIASLLASLPISYYGGSKARKPLVTGIGIMFIGVGSLMFALPHFTTEHYIPNHQELGAEEVPCLVRPGNQSDPSLDPSISIPLHDYIGMFVYGQVLHGIGACPMWILGVTYLDENLLPAQSALFIGVYYAAAAVGPAIGYMGGGQLLNLPTDLGADFSFTLEPSHPNFVGVWWLGFLINFILCFVVGFVICGFPKHLPDYEEKRANRPDESYRTRALRGAGAAPAINNNDNSSPPVDPSDKDASRTSESTASSDVAAPDPTPQTTSHSTPLKPFNPSSPPPSEPKSPPAKQSPPPSPKPAPSLDASYSSTAPMTPSPRRRGVVAKLLRKLISLLRRTRRSLTAFLRDLWTLISNPVWLLITICASAEGFVLAGFAAFLPKFLESQIGLSPAEATTSLGAILVIFGSLGMVLGGFVVNRFDLNCRQILLMCTIISFFTIPQTFALLLRCSDVKFQGVNYDSRTNLSLQQPNETLRYCDEARSICSKCDDSDFQPICSGDVMWFSACHAGCQKKDLDANKNCRCTDTVVESKRCDSDCPDYMIYVILFLLAATLFPMSFVTMPAMSATLRCVQSEMTSVGVGIQLVFGRLFGTIPGPPLFGYIFDVNCLAWSHPEDEDEAGDIEDDQERFCIFYDKEGLATSITALTSCFKLVVCLSFALAWYLYCKKHGFSNQVTTEKKEDKPEDNADGQDNPVFSIT